MALIMAFNSTNRADARCCTSTSGLRWRRFNCRRAHGAYSGFTLPFARQLRMAPSISSIVDSNSDIATLFSTGAHDTAPTRPALPSIGCDISRIHVEVTCLGDVLAWPAAAKEWREMAEAGEVVSGIGIWQMLQHTSNGPEALLRKLGFTSVHGGNEVRVLDTGIVRDARRAMFNPAMREAKPVRSVAAARCSSCARLWHGPKRG
jgi:hypothetical protein